MARLTEEMVIARSRQSDLSAIKKLNCWGAELGDVSVIRRMPNVEVLALSINKIRGLDDFAGCRRLRELYVRKNEIRDLREIRHLRRLSDLTSLWLDENPCTQHPQYRMTVLRNLPRLEKLDNVSVQPEEVQEAMRRGEYIPDSDDEGYPQPQEAFNPNGRQRSAESSPDRGYCPRSDQASDSSEEPQPEPAPEPQVAHSSPPAAAPAPSMTRSYYEVRSPEECSLRHSMSTHSVKEYSGHSEPRERPYTSPHIAHERRDRYESYGNVSSSSAGDASHHNGDREAVRDIVYERERDLPRERDAYSERERDTPRERDREREVYERERERELPRDRDRDSGHYASAVMGERRGFTRRPVTRNSNLLSALLCLVKELDYPSLEVAEMAVRCRMDELADGQ